MCGSFCRWMSTCPWCNGRRSWGQSWRTLTGKSTNVWRSWSSCVRKMSGCVRHCAARPSTFPATSCPAGNSCRSWRLTSKACWLKRLWQLILVFWTFSPQSFIQSMWEYWTVHVENLPAWGGIGDASTGCCSQNFSVLMSMHQVTQWFHSAQRFFSNGQTN